MGLIRSLVALPVSGPMNATMWLAEKVQEAAEQELNDPAALRKALTRLEQQLLRGEISEDDYDDAETVLLQRLKEAK